MPHRDSSRKEEPEPVSLQRWRVTSGKAGQSPLQITPYGPVPPMDMNGFTPEPTPQSSPIFDSNNRGFMQTPNNQNLLSAPNTMPRLNTRSVSSTSWLFSATNSPTSTMGEPSPGGLPINGELRNSREESPQWSSAVGKAGLGKTGRVIERLMQENDKLKRDIKAEQSGREDVEHQLEAQRPKIDLLEQENAHLVQMRAVDETIFEKRARQIKDLKEQLEEERNRRRGAEEKVRGALVERDDSLEKCRRDVGEAQEMARREKAHADVLEISHKQLGSEYRSRFQSVKSDLGNIITQRDEDRRKMERLEVVIDQMRQEGERAAKANSQMVAIVEEYKNTFSSLIGQLAEKDRTNSELQDEIHDVMGRMKWVMNVKRDVHETD